MNLAGRGSQAVSPSDQARNQIDFQFLNFTHPSEAREAGARRKVRSHVTKQQHQREQQAAVNRRSRSYQQASPTEQEQALPQRSQAPAFPAAERSTSLPLSYASETPSASADPSSSSSPSPVASPTWPNQLDLVDVYPEEWLPYLGQIIVSRPNSINPPANLNSPTKNSLLLRNTISPPAPLTFPTSKTPKPAPSSAPASGPSS